MIKNVISNSINKGNNEYFQLIIGMKIKAKLFLAC